MAVAPATVGRLLETGHPGWVRVVGLALLPFAALAVDVCAAMQWFALRRISRA